MRTARHTERYLHGPVPGVPGYAVLHRELPRGGGGGDPVRPRGGAIRVELESGPAAAAEARAALALLDGHADQDALDDVRLLVSELVTNAVRHSASPPGSTVELTAGDYGSSLRVEVTDGGRGFEPRPRSRAATEAGGWGLHLVDRIADRWGVTRGERTSVWFEVDGDRG